MSRIYTSIEDVIGNTPLINLTKIEEKFRLKAKLFAKLESFEPAGSAKDRVAKQMIEDAETAGKLRPGSVIIEPTSGNTGIGLAMIGVLKGYRVIIVMPETMSEERKLLMKAYGAELVLTEGTLGMNGSIQKAKELANEIPNSFLPDQFANPSNLKAHYETTGPEIYRDTDGKVDIFVAGVGTGGTISGVGKYLKEKNSDTKIVAVEPKSSPFLSEGIGGSHKIQGIGAGFQPEILCLDVIDEVLTVSDEDAYQMGSMLAKNEGILAGISSGAALDVAIRVALREENEGKHIVVLLPDTGTRYLSTGMF